MFSDWWGCLVVEADIILAVLIRLKVTFEKNSGSDLALHICDLLSFFL